MFDLIKIWYRQNFPANKTQQARGKVLKSSFTFGQGGHQVTVIDDVSYITFWDALTKNWKMGDEVNFEVYWAWANLGYGKTQWLRHARNITLAK